MPDEPETTTTDQDTDADKATDWKAEADKWKALARKHEGQAKSNADAAKRLSELEDKDKSESQKLADKVTLAEKRAAEAEAKVFRYEVASEMGIQPKHLKYLSGATKEELEESAKGILDDFPETYAKSDTDKDAAKDDKSSRPKERLRSGAAPDGEPEETDPAKIIANLPRL